MRKLATDQKQNPLPPRCMIHDGEPKRSLPVYMKLSQKTTNVTCTDPTSYQTFLKGPNQISMANTMRNSAILYYHIATTWWNFRLLT